jgi:pyruvate,water dikinase
MEYMQIRPYPIDMTTWMPEIGKALPRMVPLGSAAPSFAEMWVEEEGVVTRLAGWPEFRVNPGLLLVLPRLIALAIRYDPRDWRAGPILAGVLQDVRALEARDPRSLSWQQLLDLIREGLAIPFDVVELRRRYFPRTILAMGALRLILGRIGRPDLFGQLLSGVDNKTLEANRGLEALATNISADSALSAIFATHDGAGLAHALVQDPAGRAFRQRLDGFLAHYGHRELGSPLLVSQPTWRDAPEAVLGMLKGLAQAERNPTPGIPGWERARDDVLAHAPFRWGLPRQIFLTILAEARCFPALREDTHFYMTMPMPVIRRALLEIGRRLVDAGILATPEDLFHLRLEELEPLASSWPPDRHTVDALRETVQQRSARRAQLANTPLLDMKAPPAAEPVGEALLAGTPASPGIAEGPVRIITGPAEFGTLAPGEILVAPYTLPAWTPLFAHAAAVVVDAGSAMSHAAIVAREYGIPAVMGTGDGTRRVRNGQRVLVDGARGLVFPADQRIGESSPRE